MINPQHDELFERVARNTQYSNQIQKVFLSCNTTKADKEKLVGDLHSYNGGIDCLVTYVKSMALGVREDLLRDELSKNLSSIAEPPKQSC